MASINSAATVAQATDQINSSRASLTQNFETFLSLLTAQLKNQDPLSPMDSNQFTAQLVQMSGVEQQLLTNDLLKSLVSQSNGSLTGGVSYIGKTITAAGDAAKLSGGDAKWSYELAANAASVELEITDAAGNVVWKGPAPDKTAGIHDFVWDGKNSAGSKLVDGGVYKLKVTAKSSSGATIQSQPLIRGRATGVEMANGEAYLTIGDSIVALANVISVEETPSS
jgi:flagellar basal-body rod modification protein FlgD